MPVTNLTRRGIAALPAVSKRTLYFDADLKGFGLRVSPPSARHPAGSRVFFIKYRPRGANDPKRFVIASTAEMTPEAARQRAKDLLADVRKNSDPMHEKDAARQGKTVKELLNAFQTDHIEAKKKPSIHKTYRSMIDRHIVPALGSRKAESIDYTDIARLHRKLGRGGAAVLKKGERKAGQGRANRVLALLHSAFNWGAKEGYLPRKHPNPCDDVDKFKENRRQRYLNAEEFGRLGKTLRLAETVGFEWQPDASKPKANRAPKNRLVKFDQFAVAGIRLLALSGCRLGEILNLEWSHVNFEHGALLLPDSKTGAKTVLVGAPVLEVLASLPRVGKYVIAGERAGAGTEDEKPRSDLKRVWARVRLHAGLNDVRLHDLRHSFASKAVGAGIGLPVIGALLGHASPQTTARYTHLGSDPLRRGVETTSSTISGDMSGKASATVIPIRPDGIQ